MEDTRLGLAIRTMRRRRGWRQLDLAIAAGLSLTAVSAIERGHVRTTSLQAVRSIVGALDGGSADPGGGPASAARDPIRAPPSTCQRSGC